MSVNKLLMIVSSKMEVVEVREQLEEQLQQLLPEIEQ